MDLEIDHKQTTDGFQHITINGEIDAYTAPQLRETLIPLVEKNGETVVVELSQVGYMDSTGLGIFVAGLKASKRSGSHLKLEGMTPRVRRLFEITGLIDIIDVENSVEGGTK